MYMVHPLPEWSVLLKRKTIAKRVGVSRLSTDISTKDIGGRAPFDVDVNSLAWRNWVCRLPRALCSCSEVLPLTTHGTVHEELLELLDGIVDICLPISCVWSSAWHCVGAEMMLELGHCCLHKSGCTPMHWDTSEWYLNLVRDRRDVQQSAT